MDAQTIINIAFGLIGGLGGWILNSLKESIIDLQRNHKELQTADTNLTDKVQRIELLVVGDYVKHDDFKEFGTAIFVKLDKIYDALGKKADK